jgi:hypothetical protein
MTEKDILRAMGGIDSSLILDAEKPRKKTNWLKWASIAAGFCLIVYLGFMMKIAFTGANAPGPVSIQYESIAEMNEALGRETLYSDDNIENAFNISVSYTDDGTGNADLSHPNQALIRASDGDVTVFYYVIFNRDSVDKSYVGGYREQNLRREIGGVTVHYSKTFDGKYYENQAKFVYGGDLYVIDFISQEDTHDIMNYIEKLLG